MKPKSFVPVLAVLASTWCVIPLRAQTPDNDTSIIQRRMVEWASAAQAGDITRYVSFLSEAFSFMPPGQSAIHTKADVVRFLKPAFDGADFEITVDSPEELVVAGPWAYARYRGVLIARPKAGGPAIRMDRKIIDVWQRQPDGDWKCHIHIWNDNAAPTHVSTNNHVNGRTQLPAVEHFDATSPAPPSAAAQGDGHQPIKGVRF